MHLGEVKKPLVGEYRYCHFGYQTGVPDNSALFYLPQNRHVASCQLQLKVDIMAGSVRLSSDKKLGRMLPLAGRQSSSSERRGSILEKRFSSLDSGLYDSIKTDPSKCGYGVVFALIEEVSWTDRWVEVI